MTKNIKLIMILGSTAVVAGAAAYPIKLAITKLQKNSSNSPVLTNQKSFEYQKVIENIDNFNKQRPSFDNLNAEKDAFVKLQNQINERINKIKGFQNKIQDELKRTQNINLSFNQNILPIKEDLKIFLNDIIDKNNEIQAVKLNQELNSNQIKSLKSFLDENNNRLNSKWDIYLKLIKKHNENLKKLSADTDEIPWVKQSYEQTALLESNIQTLLNEINNNVWLETDDFLGYYNHINKIINDVIGLIDSSDIYINFWIKHDLNININYANSIKNNESSLKSLQQNMNLLNQNLQTYKETVNKFIESTNLLKKTLSESKNSLQQKQESYLNYLNNYKKVINDAYTKQLTLYQSALKTSQNNDIKKIASNMNDAISKQEKEFEDKYNKEEKAENKFNNISNFISKDFWFLQKNWYKLSQNVLDNENNVSKKAFDNDIKLNDKNIVVLNLYNQLNKVNHRNMDLKNELIRQNNELDKIDKLYKENNSDELYIKKQIFLRDIDKTKRLIEDTDNKIKQTQNQINQEINKYDEILKNTDKYFTGSLQLSNANSLFFSINEENMSTIKAQGRQIALLETDINDKKKLIDLLKGNINDLTDSKRKLESKLTQLDNDKKELEQKLNETKKITNKMNQQNDDNLKIINTKNKEIEILRQKDSENEKLIQTKRNEIDRINTENLKIQEQIQFNRQKIQQLNGQLDGKVEIIDNLNTQIQQLNGQLTQNQNAINAKAKEIQQLTNQNSELREQIQQKDEEILEHQRTIAENTKIIEGKDKEIKHLLQTLRSAYQARDEIANNTKNYGENIVAMYLEINKLKEQLNDINQKYADTDQEKNRLQASLNTLTTNFNNLQNQNNNNLNEIQLLNKRNNDLKDNKTKLLSDYQSMINKYEFTKKQYEDLKLENYEYRRKWGVAGELNREKDVTIAVLNKKIINYNELIKLVKELRDIYDGISKKSKYRYREGPSSSGYPYTGSEMYEKIDYGATYEYHARKFLENAKPYYENEE
ncbi:hypothetical protein [Mycoplasma sp. 4423]